jgi:5-methylcytosine-specific restriction protein A
MPRAPRRCPGDNYQCPNLIRSGKYCPDHKQSWQGRTTGQGSTRASRKARDKCLADAGRRCQLQHPGCTGRANEAHHAQGVAATGRTRAEAVDDGKLIAACAWCHGIETQKQATAGHSAWKRQPEHHPGLR